MKRAVLGLLVLLVQLAVGCSAREVQRTSVPQPISAPAPPPGIGRSRTKLLVEPRDGVRPLVRAIDAATHTVFVEAYILTQRSIVRALERAAAQGVSVYVLLDPQPFGMGTQPATLASSLKAAGVAVRWTSHRYYYTHAKFLVIDDRLAIVSTANLSQAAFTTNRELIVFDRARQDVHDLSNLFRSDWDHLQFATHDPELIVSPGSRTPLSAFLRRARRTVDVYAEEVADPELAGLLIRLQRRVQVRVLVAATYKSPELTQLLAEGVRVRGLGRPYVHAKMFLEDGREAFIGSENMSPTSLDANREVGILLRGAAVAHAASVFDQDWSSGVSNAETRVK